MMINKTTNTIIKRPNSDDKSNWGHGVFAMITFAQMRTISSDIMLRLVITARYRVIVSQNNYLIVAHSILFCERLCLYRFRLRVPSDVI